MIKQILSARYSGSEIVAPPHQLRVEWAVKYVYIKLGEDMAITPTRILHIR